MPLTLTQLRNRVIANIGTTPPASGDNLTAYLNEGQRDLAKDSQKIVKADVTVAVDNFSIPAACLVLRSVAYQGRELTPYPGEVLPAIYDGTPNYYMQVGSTVYVFPKLAGTYQITYTARPADLALASDTSSLTDADEALIAFATYQYYSEDADYSPTRSSFWLGVYLEKKQDWLNLDAKQNYRRAEVRDSLRNYWGS